MYLKKQTKKTPPNSYVYVFCSSFSCHCICLNATRRALKVSEVHITVVTPKDPLTAAGVTK